MSVRSVRHMLFCLKRFKKKKEKKTYSPLPKGEREGYSTLERQTETEPKEVMTRSSHRGDGSRQWHDSEHCMGCMAPAPSPVLLGLFKKGIVNMQEIGGVMTEFL